MQCCSLQCRTLLPSPVTSVTGCCFHFGFVSSFFLELFFHSSPVAYWAPTHLGSSSFSVISFCLFILFMGFSRQEYWSGLPFPFQQTTFCHNSPPWHICLSWPYMAWLWGIRVSSLWKLPDGRDWLWEKLGLGNQSLFLVLKRNFFHCSSHEFLSNILCSQGFSTSFIPTSISGSFGIFQIFPQTTIYTQSSFPWP